MQRIFRKPDGTLQSILPSQDNLIQPDWAQLTDVEVDALKNPPKSNEELKNDILTRLAKIDYLSLRPLRALTNGKATQSDAGKLKALDDEAQTLRNELATL